MDIIMGSNDQLELVLIFVAHRNNLVCAALHECNLRQNEVNV